MIDSLEREDIEELRFAKGSCVSLYMPTVVGNAAQECRLRELIDVAHTRLVGWGLTVEEARDLLAPVSELTEDRNFWKQQSAGLAILVGAGQFRTCRMPCTPPELVIVAPRFHIRPLLACLEQAEAYVLALDVESTRVIRVMGEASREVDVPAMPSSARDVSAAVLREGRHFHPAGHSRSAAPVARSFSKEDSDVNLCQAVDRALVRYLGMGRAPLILAADEPIMSVYGRVNRYEELADETVPGSPVRTSNDSLALAAGRVLRGLEKEREAQLLERYATDQPLGRTRERIRNVLPAAQAGRVDVLIADPRKVHWGLVTSDGLYTLADASTPGAEDLINRAAIETVARGGRVVEFEQPDEGPDVLALLRY